MNARFNLFASIKNRLSSGHPLSSRGCQPRSVHAGMTRKETVLFYSSPLTLRELLYFSLDLKSTYKSLWLGPVLVCWNFTWPERGLWIGWRAE